MAGPLPLQVVILCAKRDHKFAADLHVHLRGLHRTNMVNTTVADPGTARKMVELSFPVVIALMSADIDPLDLGWLRSRSDEGALRLIPVTLRSCAENKLLGLETLPKSGRNVADLKKSERDGAWTEVNVAARGVAEELWVARGKSHSRAQLWDAYNAARVPGPHFNVVDDDDAQVLSKSMVAKLLEMLPQEDRPHPLQRFLEHLSSSHVQGGHVEGQIGMRVLVSVEERERQYWARIYVLRDGEKTAVQRELIHLGAWGASTLKQLSKPLSDVCSSERLRESQVRFEFLVPRCLMCVAFEDIELRFGRRTSPLRFRSEVVVRSQERWFDPELDDARRRWEARTSHHHKGPHHALRWIKPADRPERLDAALVADDICCVALTKAPAEAPESLDLDIPQAAIYAGIPHAVWLRDPGCNDARTALEPEIGAPGGAQLPASIRELRRKSEDMEADASKIVRATLFWDPYEPDLLNSMTPQFEAPPTRQKD